MEPGWEGREEVMTHDHVMIMSMQRMRLNTIDQGQFCLQRVFQTSHVPRYGRCLRTALSHVWHV